MIPSFRLPLDLSRLVREAIPVLDPVLRIEEPAQSRPLVGMRRHKQKSYARFILSDRRMGDAQFMLISG
jgi:hypothetical protein